jgi:hypothetical protein
VKNLGKASVKVQLTNYLPNITKDRLVLNFDVTAFAWDAIKNSPYFAPLLTEQVQDDLGTFAACFPSRRKAYIDNYLVYIDGSSIAESSKRPYILWIPTDVKTGVVKNIIDNKDNPYDKYTLQYPDNYSTTANEYQGPKWEDKAESREPYPNDYPEIKKWLDFLGARPFATPDVTQEDDTLPSLNYICQTEVKDGLWWGIESSSFLNENMPFWVTIKRELSPSSSKHETFIVISLGIDSENQAYDLILSNNKRARLIDYYNGRPAYDQVTSTDTTAEEGPQAPSNEVEFSSDLARILDSEKEINIGFMCIGGRLVIFVNKTFLIYTRVIRSNDESSGTILEAKIPPGAIRIYGTNIKVAMNVCPMTFAPLSIMALPIPPIPPGVDTSGNPVPVPAYKGVDNKGDITKETVASLPRDTDSNQKVFGVDCRVFTDADGTVDYPKGKAVQSKGLVYLMRASALGLATTYDTNYYNLVMTPETVTVVLSGITWTMARGRCPYFFRLKGGAKQQKQTPDITTIDVSKDVKSISETNQAPDYFHVKKNATISLYNKGGAYDYLKSQQYGTIISWGWNGNYKNTFTGVITKTNVSERAGQEWIDLQCEDYFFILNNTFIINSPFYDGMVLFYAAKDLLQRAGVLAIVNDWDNTDEYFLPSGYCFTKPAVRFESKQTIFECLNYIIERAEAFVYFDEYGIAHVKKLTGGLFSVGASESVVERFTRDSAGPNTILDEKNTEYDFASTVNRISIFTLDRDTRNAIIYTRSAEGLEDRLIYRRVNLEDQAALGAWNVAVARAEELGKRIFFPIRKMSFKTVGEVSTLKPLDFIEVDGQEFRLMSIARKYNAESNDFTNEYNAEWKGGLGESDTPTTTTQTTTHT